MGDCENLSHRPIEFFGFRLPIHGCLYLHRIQRVHKLMPIVDIGLLKPLKLTKETCEYLTLP
jgi:hypothetical protein